MESAPSPPAADRLTAIDSVVFHAKQHAASDPAGGCLKYIHHLENKICSLQNELADSQARLALYQESHDVWSRLELDCLWVAVRRHGCSNWTAVLGDHRNEILRKRTPEELAAKWKEEQLKLLARSFQDTNIN